MKNMFKIFNKTKQILSPIKGKTINLSNVNDPVFSQKILGDGVGLILEDNTIVAPCDGFLSLIFDTNHAVGLTLDDGTEILIHIGINTVELKGKGFKRLVEPNQKVKCGTPLIEVDLDFIKSQNYDVTTVLLITNMDLIKSMSPQTGLSVNKGDCVIQYK